MKRVLLVATVLLSAATCNVDVAKITNTRMATSRNDRKTSMRRNKNFLEKPSEETLFSSGARPFAKLFESSAISAARYLSGNERRRSQQNEAKKSTGRKYLMRYRSATAPIATASTEPLGVPLETDESDFSLYNSKNECPLCYPRQQGGELQQPFYVEEPSWIEIDTDYAENQPIRRLKSTDPFVISRGKKMPPSADRTKQKSWTSYDNFNVSIRNRFLDDDNEEDDDHDDRSDEQKVPENTLEREEMLASKETLARQRTKQEILLRLFRHRINKFRLRNNVVQNFHGNSPDDRDSLPVVDRNEAAYRTNHRIHGDIESLDAPIEARRQIKRSDLFDSFEQPYFPFRVQTDSRRFGEQSDASLFQRSKSKRLDSDPLFERLAAKEMLPPRFIGNFECNLERCKDNGRTTKRTRLGDGRETLEDMLTKSDPFYVARGKRIRPSFDFDSSSSMGNVSPANDSLIDTIDANDRNL